MASQKFINDFNGYIEDKAKRLGIINFELAKAIRELGVNQQSAFVYSQWSNSGKYNVHSKKTAHRYYRKNLKLLDESQDLALQLYSAFSSFELGVMLVNQWNYVQLIKTVRDSKTNTWSWVVDDYSIKEDTEAKARGKLLLYLLTNNFIKAGDLNDVSYLTDNINEVDEEF